MTACRIDHLHLRSPDPEAAARFYVSALEAKETGRVEVNGALRIMLDLGGLNGSSFPEMSNVTASLIVAYPVSVSAPGQYTDDSALFVPGCGTAGDEATWNAGESRLEVDLHQATSVPGLYAAGDVVRGLNQIAVATAEAAVAATDIHNRLRRIDGLTVAD